MLLSLSFNSVRLSQTTDLQSVPTRKRPHAPIALRMHQFCLKGSTARAFQSQRGRPPRFSRHFSLITSSVNVGPPRIEQHVEGDKRPMSLYIGSQWKRKLLNFLLPSVNIPPALVTLLTYRYSNDRIVR
jgi:hypothetical protein